MQRAVFFDRDGVVNKRLVDDYVKSWSEFEFLPEVFPLLAQVKAWGYLAIVVSNQRGIARGLMGEKDLKALHAKMQRELEARGEPPFDDIFYCPHDTADDCECRKPKPGMILDAAEKWDIDLSESWLIGDSESDVLAGNAAGCRTILIGDQEETEAEFQAEATADVQDIISRFQTPWQI